MRYLLLIYDDGRVTTATDDDPWTSFTEWLRTRGWLVTADRLYVDPRTTTVRVRDDARLVSDGPRAASAIPVGSVTIDVEHLDDAIEAAARVPGVLQGAVEIHPVRSSPLGTEGGSGSS